MSGFSATALIVLSGKAEPFRHTVLSKWDECGLLSSRCFRAKFDHFEAKVVTNEELRMMYRRYSRNPAAKAQNDSHQIMIRTIIHLHRTKETTKGFLLQLSLCCE